MNAVAKDITALIALIDEASARWTGLDWETGLSGAETEALAPTVAKDADEARGLGAIATAALERALKLTRLYDVETAVSVARGCLRGASNIERAHGDNPAWGPALEAAEQLVEDLREDLESLSADE